MIEKRMKKEKWNFVFLLFIIILISATFSTASATTATAETCTVGPAQELVASDGAVSDFFGYSVAVSGDVAVVGARQDDDTGTNSGSAYVFRKSGSTWMEYKLKASDAGVQDYFGSAVAGDGDIVVIGAPYDDDKGGDSGAVYVFRWNGSSWIEEKKLTASDGAFIDLFGSSVAFSRDDPTANTYTVVVGAYNHGNIGIGATGYGAAYVFRFNGTTWIQEQKLVAFDHAPVDYFGYSVGVSGNVAIIGAPYDDDYGSSSGSAYVFRRSGSIWDGGQKLPRSSGAAYDYFGQSVGVSGNLAVVGAYQDSSNGLGFGSTSVFRDNGSTWIEETKLYGSDSKTNDKFGFSVWAGSDVAVVGAPNAGRTDDGSINGLGAAYLFRKGGPTWLQEQKFVAANGAPYDNFGYSVGASGDAVIAGAYQHDHNGVYDSGAAYVFTCPAPTYHPADSDNGFRINISEAIKYGSYWKNGQIWPTPLNPIPIDYATSAGYIWKSGELYHYDSGFTCPQCWVVGP